MDLFSDGFVREGYCKGRGPALLLLSSYLSPAPFPALTDTAKMATSLSSLRAGTCSPIFASMGAVINSRLVSKPIFINLLLD